MMHSRYLAAGLAVMAGLLPLAAAQAASGNTATAGGAAAGTIVAPIVLIHTSGAALNFGSFTVGTGGKVDVTPRGVASTTRTVAFVPGGATPAADAFTVTGAKRTTFTITTTAGAVTNGTHTMIFTTTPSAANDTLDRAGTSSFTVGGRLTVAGTETSGNYTGSYTATIAYY